MIASLGVSRDGGYSLAKCSPFVRLRMSSCARYFVATCDEQNNDAGTSELRQVSVFFSSSCEGGFDSCPNRNFESEWIESRCPAILKSFIENTQVIKLNVERSEENTEERKKKNATRRTYYRFQGRHRHVCSDRQVTRLLLFRSV